MPNNPNQPIFILKEGTERSHGRVAQSNNIAAAKAVAESIRTTLGPKGMDKMLVDEGGDVIKNRNVMMGQPLRSYWLVNYSRSLKN